MNMPLAVLKGSAFAGTGHTRSRTRAVPSAAVSRVAAIARRLDPGQLRTPRYLIESIAAACLPV